MLERVVNADSRAMQVSRYAVAPVKIRIQRRNTSDPSNIVANEVQVLEVWSILRIEWQHSVVDDCSARTKIQDGAAGLQHCNRTPRTIPHAFSYSARRRSSQRWPPVDTLV